MPRRKTNPGALDTPPPAAKKQPRQKPRWHARRPAGAEPGGLGHLRRAAPRRRGQRAALRARVDLLLFLRVLDEQEAQEREEAEALGLPYTPSLGMPWRWQDWAAPATDAADAPTTPEGLKLGWKRRELTEGRRGAAGWTAKRRRSRATGSPGAMRRIAPPAARRRDARLLPAGPYPRSPSALADCQPRPGPDQRIGATATLNRPARDPRHRPAASRPTGRRGRVIAAIAPATRRARGATGESCSAPGPQPGSTPGAPTPTPRGGPGPPRVRPEPRLERHATAGCGSAPGGGRGLGLLLHRVRLESDGGGRRVAECTVRAPTEWHTTPTAPPPRRWCGSQAAWLLAAAFGAGVAIRVETGDA